MNIVQGYIRHAFIAQFDDDVASHLRCIICQSGCPHMSGLHHQPLFAILCNSRGFSTECGIVGFLQCLQFLVIKLLAGFPVERHTIILRIHNRGSVIGMSTYFNGSVSWDTLSFCCQYRHLQKYSQRCYPCFIRTGHFYQRYDYTIICCFAHCDRSSFSPSALLCAYFWQCIPEGRHR